MRDIYLSWNVSSCDQVSNRYALSIHQVDQSELLSNSQNKASLNGVKSNGSETSTQRLASFMEGEISVEEILCPHGRLDPGKAADMKRIDHIGIWYLV